MKRRIENPDRASYIGKYIENKTLIIPCGITKIPADAFYELNI